MTDTIRLGRLTAANIRGSDLIPTWSTRMGGNIGMSLAEFTKWLQENGGINQATTDAAAALAAATAASAAADAAEADAAAAVVTADAADLKADTAINAAAAADAKATTAQNDVNAQQPWIASDAPAQSDDIGKLDLTWSPKKWAPGEIYDPTQNSGLPDHGYTVTKGADGFYSVVLGGSNNQITSKSNYERGLHQDVLVVARVKATGVDGSTGAYVGFYRGQAGQTSGFRERDRTPLTEGVNLIYCFRSQADLALSTTLRPFVRRDGSVGVVEAQNITIIRPENGVIPFLAFSPPIDGVTDALPWFTMANAAMLRMNNRAKILDGSGCTFAVSSAAENTVASSEWRNFNINAIGTRAAWVGGSMDSRSIAMQKGVIRARNNGQIYRNINLDCGPYTSTQVVTANSVYSVYNTLANGFEDGPVGTGNKAKGLLFENCTVLNYDHYGYRYASQTGDGFDLFSSHASKRSAAAMGLSVADADADTGHGVLLDASDGKVIECTFLNGESCIRQLEGSGTIKILQNHPWRGPAVHKRRYFGTIGTVIDTGIRVRHATNQIGTYDTSKVSVARDPTTWKVMVTMLDTVAQADAVEVPIRRDEVVAHMEGWGSYWDNNYLDGGTVRFSGNGFVFPSGFGLVGAMNDVIAGFPGQGPVSAFEFQPRLNTSEMSRNLQWFNPDFGVRCIMYPRLDGLGFSATNLMFDARVMAAHAHLEDYNPIRIQSQDAGGIVSVMHSGIVGRAGFKLVPSGVSDANAPIWATGAGTPEGVLTAPVGSLFTRTDGGVSTTLYVKQTGSGNTGWAAK